MFGQYTKNGARVREKESRWAVKRKKVDDHLGCIIINLFCLVCTLCTGSCRALSPTPMYSAHEFLYLAIKVNIKKTGWTQKKKKRKIKEHVLALSTLYSSQVEEKSLFRNLCWMMSALFYFSMISLRTDLHNEKKKNKHL